jgi:hypothetical protein
MKLTSLLLLVAASLHPLLLSAQEAPTHPEKTWEIHLRADGGGNARLAEMTMRMLAPVTNTLPLEAGATFHAAGFRNPTTPGADWIAELREVAGARQFLAEAAKYGGFRLEDGTLFISKDQQTYALWATGDNVIRAVHPAENRHTTLPPAVEAPASNWVSGGIKISSIKNELPKSDLLRLLDRIDFSLNANGGEISAEVLTASVTPELAAKAAAKAHKLSAAATLVSGEEISIEDLAKDLTITQTDEKIRLQFNISEATLEKGLMGIHRFMKATRGK